MDISAEDIVRYLHMGGAKPDAALSARIEHLRTRAARTIRPAWTWRRFVISEHTIESGGETLEISGSLAKHLHGCQEACLMCGTIGTEFDTFIRKAAAISGADALIAQAIGTAAIENLMDCAECEIRKELKSGEHLTARYSPGYGDFPLTAQRTILRLLDASRRTGISLTDTLLMVPSKSVSAVAGIVNCAIVS